jgi:predicted HAD superfamily phosphohydrolase YqeG
MITQNEEIKVIKSLVERFYLKGEHKSDRHDAEDEIKHFLERQSEISDKNVDDIRERCHYIMKHGHHTFDEAWTMIEKLLTEYESGLYNQIKESVKKFFRTNSDSDRHEAQERVRDYLKHVVKLDEKTGSDSLRHEIVDDDIHDLLKYDRRNFTEFEDLWNQIEDIIDWAWTVESEYVSKDYSRMSDQELIDTFVPDVYQKNVYRIDYEKLKAAGIKVITFDIDATIGFAGIWTPSSETKNLFLKLRDMGFQMALFSNAEPPRVKSVEKDLCAFYSMGHGGKPHTFGFDRIIQQYVAKNLGTELSVNQIAHVGNDITKDIQAGNRAGVTTCMVRTFGGSFGCSRLFYKEAHRVTKELEKRGIWRKHHERINDDQYYQLGEKQK